MQRKEGNTGLSDGRGGYCRAALLKARAGETERVAVHMTELKDLKFQLCCEIINQQVWARETNLNDVFNDEEAFSNFIQSSIRAPTENVEDGNLRCEIMLTCESESGVNTNTSDERRQGETVVVAAEDGGGSKNIMLNTGKESDLRNMVADNDVYVVHGREIMGTQTIDQPENNAMVQVVDKMPGGGRKKKAWMSVEESVPKCDGLELVGGGCGL